MANNFEYLYNNPKKQPLWDFKINDINSIDIIDDSGEITTIPNKANYKSISVYDNSGMLDNVVVGSRYNHIPYEEIYPIIKREMDNIGMLPVDFVRTGRSYRNVFSSDVINIRDDEYRMVVSFNYNLQRKLDLSAFLYRKACSNGMHIVHREFESIMIGHKRKNDFNEFVVTLPDFGKVVSIGEELFDIMANSRVNAKIDLVDVKKIVNDKFVTEKEYRGSIMVDTGNIVLDFMEDLSNKDSFEVVSNYFPIYNEKMNEGMAALNSFTHWSSHHGKLNESSRFMRVERTSKLIDKILN